MPSIAARAVATLLRATHANAAYISADRARQHVEERRVRPQSYAPPTHLKGVDIRLDRLDGWPVYAVTPTSGAPSGGVVYAHGGGWVNEIVSQHWKLIAQIAAEAHVGVTVPIYPLVPFGTAGDVVARVVGLIDASRAEYGKTLVAGDSAGGQIALSAAMTLKADGGVPPDRSILISPALDLSFDNPEIPRVQPSDPWLGRPGGLVYANLWRGDLPFDDARVGPLFGDLTGLGPITMFSGTRDILNPDARLLVQKARAVGVDIEYYEGADQVHVYPLLPTPEGRAARRVLVEHVARTVA